MWSAVTAAVRDHSAGLETGAPRKEDLSDPEGFFGKIGAGDEIRTHDIHLGKVALYH